MPYMSHPKHSCASNFWVVEPDVAYFGDWATLFGKYEQQQQSLDLLAVETPYKYNTGPTPVDWVDPALNGSSAINTLKQGGYTEVYKGLNFITRFSRRLVLAVTDALSRDVRAYGELLWPSTCRAALHDCAPPPHGLHTARSRAPLRHTPCSALRHRGLFATHSACLCNLACRLPIAPLHTPVAHPCRAL